MWGLLFSTSRVVLALLKQVEAKGDKVQLLAHRTANGYTGQQNNFQNCLNQQIMQMLTGQHIT